MNPTTHMNREIRRIATIRVEVKLEGSYSTFVGIADLRQFNKKEKEQYKQQIICILIHLNDIQCRDQDAKK